MWVLPRQAVPVTWIGHRRVDCARHPAPRRVWPVRVAAHAFGAGRPERDLYLSPDHALYVDEVLIPVKYLVNGTTVAQVVRRSVRYYHVELPRHAILLAENLAAESYLDTGDRSGFANGGGAVALHPDFASRIWEAQGCAPLVVAGPKLAAARARLQLIARKVAA
ncbi:MAG: Hint domain-containing protein [Acetobacteraceae bacterium]